MSNENGEFPRTSSLALQAFFESLGLEVELWGDASDDFEEVFEAVLVWYAGPARAAAARVFSLKIDDSATAAQVFASTQFSELTEVLAGWVGEPLPPLKGQELLRYVADRLLADAVHPRGPGPRPELFVLTGSPGDLYLLGRQKSATRPVRRRASAWSRNEPHRTPRPPCRASFGSRAARQAMQLTRRAAPSARPCSRAVNSSTACPQASSSSDVDPAGKLASARRSVTAGERAPRRSPAFHR